MIGSALSDAARSFASTRTLYFSGPLYAIARDSADGPVFVGFCTTFACAMTQNVRSATTAIDVSFRVLIADNQYIRNTNLRDEKHLITAKWGIVCL